ncbi:MAG: bifunctional diaminohydroxyphosphoribosylaminopyrimidine deaminase/5-amino-6-(5-phosphoribosylamino)uracil reductase RibD [Peptoniphilus sp.]|nr:bifunctional diaminohydroxyphosphoribosylaminopyrimidine deaminase/5-amino-6-(5-phosphoribosylamino)uracil reductase RibD [Peptoniphilus sp.]MDD7362833.1 bifunctional diaminohydroxyphosphoribosylaminopyrimidine deaminase/5-amino-6-(5-phosphoribosylamino)uracil reductase RibD [Bacillota bacterium]MDY6043975.1 bifunctional diaminohydroxyphosphoribosylaminopyrimidine deaminase/5-amino-6-(5-phosphoribosylamino)uracil reductase RibD [Peptoniphilus sp.]
MDEQYMRRAISLAKRGRGRTGPNPVVGAVLVKDGKVIGEGWHHGFGHDHAEVDCLKNASEDPKDATIYVNLEPCSHYGKTPPCVKAIIKSGIKRVVIGTLDPNPKVAGRGVYILERAGLEVRTGVMKEACLVLNRPFFTSILTKRPYVTAKYATTLDGKIATKTGESKWITGEEARLDGHLLRGRVDGILVGTGTVLQDNPRLTNRSGVGVQPARIILDRRGVIDEDANVYDGTQKTIVYTSHMDDKKQETLRAREIVVVTIEERDGELPLDDVLADLYANQFIGHVLVEGGGKLHGSLIDGNFVDAFVLYMAPSIFGGGKEAVVGEGIERLADRKDFEIVDVMRLGPDVCIQGVRSCSRES